MKDTTIHYLGNEHQAWSTNWYHLHTPPNGPWHVSMEKDYDVPDKDGYTQTIDRNHLNKILIDGVKLSEIVAKKLTELGLNSN